MPESEQTRRDVKLVAESHGFAFETAASSVACIGVTALFLIMAMRENHGWLVFLAGFTGFLSYGSIVALLTRVQFIITDNSLSVRHNLVLWPNRNRFIDLDAIKYPVMRRQSTSHHGISIHSYSVSMVMKGGAEQHVFLARSKLEAKRIIDALVFAIAKTRQSER